MSNSSIYESELNIGLSDLLRKKGIAAIPEHKHGRWRHDIEIKIGMLTAVIEAEKGHTAAARKRAFDEAMGRINNQSAQIAVALCYAGGTTRANLKEQTFEWAVISPRNLQKPASWQRGKLNDLVMVILQLPNEYGNPDELAERLSNALESAVSGLGHSSKKGAARSVDLAMNGNGQLNAAAMRALLVVATAMMFHSRLDNRLKKPTLDQYKTPPEPFAGEWPPLTMMQCALSDTPYLEFLDAWRSILAVDYRPIFETAREVLLNLSAEARTASAIKIVANSVREISVESAGLRHDLLGRIFHRILDTAKFDGSFYTSTAGAALLSTLALREDDVDWEKADSIGNFRAVDPTCGTGTLLMALAERMRDLTNRAGGKTQLENILIEKVLYGYDTNLTATHLAATTLGLLSPGVKFSQINIERTFLGVDKKNSQASLGSLEFIPGGQPSLLGWAGGQQHVDDQTSRITNIGKFDLVIMNPPFTRDSLRHDQFSRKDELALKDRERDLLREYLHNGTLHRSSQGNNFVVLAEHLMKTNGTMAAVLPMVTATNPSSLGIRKFIADKFHIETIVVAHDPQRPAFSENTGISELLIICRKPKSRKQPTRVVSLTVNPQTPAEAMMLAYEIIDGEQHHSFIEHLTNADDMAAGDWSAVQFLSPRLAKSFANLRDGKFFAMTKLAKMGNMLNGRIIRGACVKTHYPPAHGMIALWDHKTTFIAAMAATHDTYIDHKAGKEEQAEKAWQQRSQLMLPARLGLPVTRALSVLLPRPAVASAWYPFTFGGKLKTKEKDKREKSLCVYLNSSLGVLALLGVRDFKILNYPSFSQDSINMLPMPNFATMPKQTTALAAVFDHHGKEEFLPLRDMNKCQTRRDLDHAVADALGLEHQVIDEIRELLSREPTVSGRRYEALNLSAD